jgi:hypothetical protein
MERLRRTDLSRQTTLGLADKSHLLHIPNLFERIVWLLRKRPALLASVEQYNMV